MPVTMLRLTGTAKTVLTALLVLAFTAIGTEFLTSCSSARHGNNDALALRRIEAANNILTKNSEGFQSAIQGCSAQLGCVSDQLKMQASHLDEFDAQIKAISLSGQAAADAARLVAAGNAEVQELDRLATATSNAAYMTIVKTNSIEQDQNNAAADYAKLVRDLGGVTT